MRKLCLRDVGALLLFALAMTSTASAVSTEIEEQTDPVVPGENNTYGYFLADFNQTENVTGVSETDFSDLPFTVYSVNGTFETNDTGFNSTLVFEVPEDFPPQETENEVGFEFDTESASIDANDEADFSVERNDNISVSPQNISFNANVGDVGSVFANLTFSQEGNARRTDSGYRVEGNVSELVQDEESNFTLFRASERVLPLRTDVVLGQRFGRYSGRVEVFSENDSETIEFNANVSDIVAPSISGGVEDVEATRSREIAFDVSDNIEVRNVSVEITLERDNQSDLELGDFALMENEDDRSRYSRVFNDTDVLGDYLVNVTARDTAGNVNIFNTSFEVTELDSISLNASSRELEAVETETKVETMIASVSFPTDVTFNLTGFDEDKTNDTMLVGIKAPGSETAEEFSIDDSEGSVLTFDEEGNYSLVVRSEQAEAYRGEVNVSGFEQHKPVGKFDFNGIFIDPEFPQPREDVRRGVFEGEIEYESKDATVKDRIIFRGSVPAERCRGFDEFSQCIPGLAFGQLEKNEEKIKELKGDKSQWRASTIVMGIAFVLFIGYKKRINQLKGITRVRFPEAPSE
jgi:hypothetical protein